mgnify:CR=1 FL=1
MIGLPERVGFLGLGTMGRAMAGRLLAAGHRVSGFDVADAALAGFAGDGGEPATSAAAAARDVGLLVVMVHDAEQVEAALAGPDGALDTLKAGATVWLASTVAPGYARRLGARLADAGVLFVDGPVSGGVAGAAAGSLTVMAGAVPGALEVAGEAMAACARHVFPVGEPGAGSLVKLMNQVLTAAHIALTAEVLALGTRCGVDPRLLADVITRSAGTSRQFERRAPAMLDGDLTPNATVATFLKDLGLAQDTAREHAFPTPLAAATHQLFLMAAGAGHAGDSDVTVLRVYERFGGVDVAGRR